MKYIRWVLAAAVALSGCSATVTGAATPPPAAAGPVIIGGAQPDAADLAQAGLQGLRTTLRDRLITGYADVTSLSGEVRIDTAEAQGRTRVAATLEDGLATAASMSMDVAVGPESVTMEALAVDGRVFVGGTLTEQYTDRRYLELTEDTTDEGLREAFRAGLQALDQLGLDYYLALVAGAGAIEPAGSEPVLGTALERYELVVDVDALFEVDGLDIVQQTARELAGVGIEELPISLWISAGGLVVQSRQEFTALGETVTMVSGPITFNGPVHIQAPAADQIEQG